jgi:hypothetical protein
MPADVIKTFDGSVALSNQQERIASHINRFETARIWDFAFVDNEVPHLREDVRALFAEYCLVSINPVVDEMGWRQTRNFFRSYLIRKYLHGIPFFLLCGPVQTVSLF